MTLSGPVLVTGASGFIGAHLVRNLLKDGIEVHVFARRGARLDRLGSEPQVTVWHGDITDADAVESCFKNVLPTAVFHLAADTAARRAPSDRDQGLRALQVNLYGLINMLNGAVSSGAPLQQFLRLGGLEEYGAGPTPSREDQREEPRSPYSVSQVAATHWCRMMQPTLAFPVVTLRPALIFGPGQSSDFLIPALIEALLQGRRFATTEGRQCRDLIFVDDAIRAIRAASGTDGLHGAVVNVSSGRHYVIRDVVSMIADMLSARRLLDIGLVPERQSDLAFLTGDPCKAQQQLQWQASTSLADGLKTTIEWYKRRAEAFPQ